MEKEQLEQLKAEIFEEFKTRFNIQEKDIVNEETKKNELILYNNEKDNNEKDIIQLEPYTFIEENWTFPEKKWYQKCAPSPIVTKEEVCLYLPKCMSDGPIEFDTYLGKIQYYKYNGEVYHLCGDAVNRERGYMNDGSTQTYYKISQIKRLVTLKEYEQFKNENN